MIKTYQWTKGDKIGSIVKSVGEKFIDENIEYCVFCDGSMINSSLINEYLMEIPSESEAIMLHDLSPTPMQKVEKKELTKEPNIQANQSKQTEMSPLEKLLFDSKKKKEVFVVNLEIDLPSAELMKVLADSYSDGEKQILKFLSSSIQFQEIKEKISVQIAEKVFDRKPKTPKKKNEGPQSTV